MTDITVTPYYPERKNGWAGFMGFSNADCTGSTVKSDIYGWEKKNEASLAAFKSFKVPPKTEIVVFKDANWNSKVGTYFGSYDDAS